MTTARVMQDNGQEAWVATCNKPTAEGENCDYVGRSNESAAAAEKLLLDHQALRPNDGEIGLRPPREITQHYPHFVSFDLPNAGQDDPAVGNTGATAFTAVAGSAPAVVAFDNDVVNLSAAGTPAVDSDSGDQHASASHTADTPAEGEESGQPA